MGKKQSIIKGFLLVCLLALIPSAVHAQQLKFGYFSYDNALRAVPEYNIAQRNLTSLRAQYDREAKRSEEDFNKKYEAFLEGLAEMDAPIRLKRQAELQDMMEKNIAFKQKAKQLLRSAERDAMTPLRTKVNDAVQKVGRERGYAFILNTDDNACPYVDTNMGEDATTFIKDELTK